MRGFSMRGSCGWIDVSPSGGLIPGEHGGSALPRLEPDRYPLSPARALGFGEREEGAESKSLEAATGPAGGSKALSTAGREQATRRSQPVYLSCLLHATGSRISWRVAVWCSGGLSSCSGLNR